MYFPLDSIIFGFLAADGLLLAILAWRWQYVKKHRILGQSIFICIAALAWIVVFYGSFIEPQILLVNEQKIDLRSDTSSDALREIDEISVAFFGDLHVGPYKQTKFVERVVRRTNELKPDLILLGGDFVFDSREQTKFLEPLEDLRAPLGVFAILGNHDYGESLPFSDIRGKTVHKTLENLGIKVLMNEGVWIDVGNVGFYLLGIDDMWFGKPDISLALQSLKNSAAAGEIPDAPKILLSHNPDIIIEAEKLGIDLVLAAHTHAGQIRLPFFGSVPEIPDNLGRSYDRGLFGFGSSQLFITSGAGEVGPRARLFAPPEISLLKIRF